MLANLNDVLRPAKHGKYAVGLFNAVNLELARGIIAAAETSRSPVIMGTAEVLLPYGPLEEVSYYLLPMAKKASVPVVIHLDHGQSLEQVRLALDSGFTSVMIDGSKLPFEENIKISKETLKLANAVGASVEAELGCILGVEDDISHDDNKPFLVRTEDVLAFNKEVTVDALAIGIGNAHGIYKGLPNLDFQRLSEVNDISNVPLVLHGGSGIPADMIQKAISLGIRKINVATEIRLAYVKGLTKEVESGDFYTMSNAGKAEVVALAKEKIRLFKNGNVE